MSQNNITKIFIFKPLPSQNSGCAPALCCYYYYCRLCFPFLFWQVSIWQL